MNYTFKINDFEGPFDLLLHLVKTSKMDIYEISIKDLIDEYINFIKEQEKLNIDIASEYLVMASELLHLKSRMLINKEIESDEEEVAGEITSEEDLRNKLIEYERIKGITSAFKELEDKRGEIYEKSPENYLSFADEIKYESSVASVDELYNAFLEFQKRLKYSKPLKTKITTKEISIDDRIKSIRDVLSKRDKVEFFELFDNYTKDYIVVTFLSILNMSKTGEINIVQEDNFKPIIIEKR